MTRGVYETSLKYCTFKLRDKPSIYCYIYSNNMFIVVVFISTLVQFTLCPICTSVSHNQRRGEAQDVL